MQLPLTTKFCTAPANVSRTQSTTCHAYSLPTQHMRKRLHLLDSSPILLRCPSPHTVCLLALPRLPSVVSQTVLQEESQEQNNLLRVCSLELD